MATATPQITLTTDFGGAGPYVSVMKSVIRAHAPGVEIADLTHHVAPCYPAEAGFWLARSYRWFPAGSVHVAVVDPGVGTDRAILACDWDGHVFLAPDNGILPMVVGPAARLHALSPAWLRMQGWPVASHTFHGRDIFAPLAAALITGAAHPADIGPATPAAAGPAVAPAAVEPGGVSGTVVAVDTWGNLVSNIDAALLAGLSSPRVSIGHREVKLATTYGDAPPGALTALVNSFGVLEVAWPGGSAAELLNLGRGTRIHVRAGN